MTGRAAVADDVRGQRGDEEAERHADHGQQDDPAAAGSPRTMAAMPRAMATSPSGIGHSQIAKAAAPTPMHAASWPGARRRLPPVGVVLDVEDPCAAG